MITLWLIAHDTKLEPESEIVFLFPLLLLSNELDVALCFDAVAGKRRRRAICSGRRGTREIGVHHVGRAAKRKRVSPSSISTVCSSRLQASSVAFFYRVLPDSNWSRHFLRTLYWGLTISSKCYSIRHDFFSKEKKDFFQIHQLWFSSQAWSFSFLILKVF